MIRPQNKTVIVVLGESLKPRIPEKDTEDQTMNIVKNKVVIIGNGKTDWIINEAFRELNPNDYPDIIMIHPYDLSKKEKDEYQESFTSANRKYLYGYPASRWRKYSPLLNMSIEDDVIIHLFFMFGRDIQRLFDPFLIDWMKYKYCDKVKIYLILFDSINVTQDFRGWGRVVDTFEKFDHVCSFDPDDCKKYGLIYFTEPFSRQINCSNEGFIYDLFFTGCEKGRGKLLKEIATGVTEHGLTASFLVQSIHDEYIVEGIKKTLHIPYNETLRYLIKSKCLLELVSEGQSGCSYRYYEAVVYNKKLISNCKNIVNMPHYDPRYMKLIESAEDIDYDWLKKDEPVDYHYSNAFSVRNFVNTILEEAGKKPIVRTQTPEASPLVSVVIPTFNRATTIRASIESVLRQTYSNIEVIVVDDGSTDRTQSIVTAIDDSRVRYIYQENQGACVARNTGIEASKGIYIAFQDSDDEWHPDKLKRQVEILQNNPAVDIVFCNAMKYTQTDKSDGKMLVPVSTPAYVTRDELQARSRVSTQTMVMRRMCLDDIKFDPLMPRLQDFDLVYRLAESYAFYFLHEPLVNMYLQDDSISADPNKSIVARKRMIEKYPYVMRRNLNAYIDMLTSIVVNSEKAGKPDEVARVQLDNAVELKMLRERAGILKIGRLLTWLPRKVRYGVQCYRRHGAAYTLRHALSHIGIRKVQ